MLIVRPVERHDSSAWLELRSALWPETSREQHEREVERFFSGAIPEPQAVFLALEGPAGIVGIIELSVRPHAEGCVTERVAYVEGWYVSPRARGRGIGRALMRAAEQWGRSVGCSELASDTEAHNEQSRLAHTALGFQDLGLIRCFRKEL